MPDVGSSPGEIVRNKQKPLDTSNLREPLRQIIDWMCAPKIEDRPASASEALARVSAVLKPSTAEAEPSKRRSPLVIGLAAVLAAAVAGGWLFRDKLSPQPLPVASPYRLDVALGPDGAALSGHAPDAETAAMLTETVTRIAGAAPAGDGLGLASGMPGEDWPQHAEELLDLAGQLDRWDLAIADRSAVISGLAADRAERDALEESLDAWRAVSGFALRDNLVAGPEILGADQVAEELSGLSTCGPLELAGAPRPIRWARRSP